jgi:catechol 2,3-dioxygenase-like lactoylglutathione lyase family enzyme
MFIGFEHTAIGSPKPQKLAQWYADNLGFHIEQISPTTVFVKAPDGSVIEILASNTLRQAQSPKDPGLQHLAISVDNFEAAYDTLKAREVNFLAAPVIRPGFKLVFFTDLDGNYLHLIYREQSS